jgi:hypothetical protein
MRAAPFIADPAGDADGQLQFQITLKLARRSRKAMRHRSTQACAMLAQNRNEVRVRITLVQEHGLSRGSGEFQLAVESSTLRTMRGKIAVVVEAALTNCDDLGSLRKRANAARLFGRPFIRVVRMYAGGGKEPLRMRSREFQSLARTIDACAGDYHLRHAGSARAREHGVAVGSKSSVRQIDADVDKWRRLVGRCGARAELCSMD